MSVFAISDLHLSLNSTTDKSMEVFGRRWQGYVKKLESNWRALVGEHDTVILAGDISWALSIDEAVDDFLYGRGGNAEAHALVDDARDF